MRVRVRVRVRVRGIGLGLEQTCPEADRREPGRPPVEVEGRSRGDAVEVEGRKGGAASGEGARLEVDGELGSREEGEEEAGSEELRQGRLRGREG